MALYEINNVSIPTGLASDINASVLSFTVTTSEGASYPTGRQIILIDNELVDVSSRSGDVFTVVSGGRGFGGTTATSHTSAAALVDLVTPAEGYGLTLDSAGDYYAVGGINMNGETLYGPLDPSAGTHVGDRDYNDARYAELSGATFTGAILADYGTEPLPGYAFDGDPDTGIRRNTANEMTFVAGGTDRMTLSTTELNLKMNDGANEGGQLKFDGWGATYTDQFVWDRYQDTMRLLFAGGVIHRMSDTGKQTLYDDILFNANTPFIEMMSPDGSTHGYGILANLNDANDFGLAFRHWGGASFSDVMVITGSEVGFDQDLMPYSGATDINLGGSTAGDRFANLYLLTADAAGAAATEGRVHWSNNDWLSYIDADNEWHLVADGIHRASIKESVWANDTKVWGTSHADDQEFDDALGGTAVTPTGTATWTQDRSRLSVVYDSVASADHAVRLYSLTSPAAGLVVETMVERLHDDASNPMVGICLTDGTATSSNSQALMVYWVAGGIHYTCREYAGTITNMTAGGQAPLVHHGRLYLRLEWVSANTFGFSVSPDGVSWTSLGIANNAKTMTPTHMGVVVTNWGATDDAVASFEYLRRVSG